MKGEEKMDKKTTAIYRLKARKQRMAGWQCGKQKGNNDRRRPESLTD